MQKKKLILVTDGDNAARRAVEEAAHNLGLRCISRSATLKDQRPATGERLVQLIKEAHGDIVLVMFDDQGNSHEGRGEKELRKIAKHPDFEILGALAVASNTDGTEGVKIDCSVNQNCVLVARPVDKQGMPEKIGHRKIEGDTVDILNELDVPIIIGIGDLGKMDGADWPNHGAPVTTKAVEEILKRSGVIALAGKVD